MVRLRLGVVGAGTMGAGIAELGCLAGIDTVLVDADHAALERAVAQIGARLQRAVERSRLDDAEAALVRLSPAHSMAEFADRDLVIEAVPERLAVKHAVVRALSDACAEDAVIATNTSSLPVAEIAVAARHPERVLGMHFFNPAPAMPLVELVAAPLTSAAALERAANTARAMDKRVIRALDGPGFLVNRCARPYYLEALRILDESVAEPEQVDRICRLAGFPMGPFELMDLIGIDVGLEVTRAMYQRGGHEPRWRPSPTQERLVAAGRLGRKVGHGFYDYAKPRPERKEDAPTGGDNTVLGRIVAQLVNEAAFAVEAGVGTAADVDVGLRLGLRFPRGPLEWGDAIGPARVVAILDQLAGLAPDDRYGVAPLLRRAATEGRPLAGDA